MALPVYADVFTFLSIAIDIFIAYLILRKREQANLRMNWYLIFTIFSIMIWIICVYLQEAVFPFYPNQNVDVVLPFAILAFISNAAIGFGLLMLSFFIKYFVQPTLDFAQSSYLLSLVVLITGLYFVIITGAYIQNTSIVDITFNVANLFNLILVVSIIIFTRKDMNYIRKEAVDFQPKVQKQLNFLNYGLNLALIGIIPLLIIANFFERAVISFSFILLAASLVMIAYAYLIDPNVVYILSERVYQAIVVNHQGVLRYSKIFTGEKDEDSTVLISGALNAITALMSEFYETTVYPTNIKFDQRLILFKWSDYFYLAVFADRESRLVKEAMDSAVREIEKRFEGNLEKTMRHPEILKLDDIFHNSFYFIIDEAETK